MAVGCRSTRIVLMKPGNWSRRTRWREGKTERGCLMLDPGSGNTSEASYSELRITDTAQDSIPGMQRCCMANPSLEEPYALMWARTGLWEPWVRNHPRPPGPACRSRFSSMLRSRNLEPEIWECVPKPSSLHRCVYRRVEANPIRAVNWSNRLELRDRLRAGGATHLVVLGRGRRRLRRLHCSAIAT